VVSALTGLLPAEGGLEGAFTEVWLGTLISGSPEPCSENFTGKKKGRKWLHSISRHDDNDDDDDDRQDMHK